MRAMFSTDGKGKWVRTTWPQQCDSDLLFGKRCQGVKGHEGQHWRYGDSGNFEHSTPNGGWASTPPGHKKYITPLEMQQHFYNTHSTTVVVTDVDEIARLERGELGDNESIMRPMDLKSISKGVLEKISKSLTEP